MKKLFFSLIICFVILEACSFAPGLAGEEIQLYTSDSGYHISVPATWQLLTEDAQSAIFIAPENDISLTIISELGGEAYYSLMEIAQMMLDQLPQSQSDWQVKRTIANSDDKLRLSITGEDEAGAELVLDLSVLQPHPGIRYYLLFATNSTAAFQKEALFDDIGKSFGLDADLPYLYTLMEEWRSQEQE
ncbi:MAG: hypothetical protein FWG61_02125 [Firmicutes bacterium]|nr:hypothetical protein [Bacillota bacterium]